MLLLELLLHVNLFSYLCTFKWAQIFLFIFLCWWRNTYFFGYKTEFFSIPKQSQKSRSILYDGSRSLGLLRKAKSRILAKVHRTVIVIFVVILESGKCCLLAE